RDSDVIVVVDGDCSVAADQNVMGNRHVFAVGDQEILAEIVAEAHFVFFDDGVADGVQVDADAGDEAQYVIGDGNAVGGVEQNSGGQIVEGISAGRAADDKISGNRCGLDTKSIARIGGRGASAGKI